MPPLEDTSGYNRNQKRQIKKLLEENNPFKVKKYYEAMKTRQVYDSGCMDIAMDILCNTIERELAIENCIERLRLLFDITPMKRQALRKKILVKIDKKVSLRLKTVNSPLGLKQLFLACPGPCPARRKIINKWDNLFLEKLEKCFLSPKAIAQDEELTYLFLFSPVGSQCAEVAKVYVEEVCTVVAKKARSQKEIHDLRILSQLMCTEILRKFNDQILRMLKKASAQTT